MSYQRLRIGALVAACTLAAAVAPGCSKNVREVGEPPPAPEAKRAPMPTPTADPQGGSKDPSLVHGGGARAMPPGHPAVGQRGSGGAQLEWKAPSSWRATKPSTRMRRAQYELPGAKGAPAAELVVYHFPGMGGSVRANLTRWSRQFKATKGASASKPVVKQREVRGLSVTTVHHVGTFLKPERPMALSGPKKELPGYALLGAIVETPTGPWFFKAVGPKQTIARHRDAFDELLASLQLEGSKADKPAGAAAASKP